MQSDDDEINKIDTFEPDYETPCEACGSVPTVTGVKDNVVVYSSGMCGCCLWGDAELLDPDNW